MQQAARTRTPKNASVTALSWVILSGLVLLLLAVPARGPAQESPRGGAIEGSIRISEKLTAQRMRFRLYPGARPAPPRSGGEGRDNEYRNVVVYLRPDTPLPPAERTDDQVFRMAQEGETFIPHVLPIPVGSTVEFPNLDPIFHNVFSLSGTRTFDLGRYPKGDSRSVLFDRPGIVPVFCHIHSDMGAIILVLENALFSVPDTDRKYRISDIPPGSYTLVAWHERASPVEERVEVKEGQTLELDLTVPIETDEPAGP